MTKWETNTTGSPFSAISGVHNRADGRDNARDKYTGSSMGYNTIVGNYDSHNGAANFQYGEQIEHVPGVAEGYHGNIKDQLGGNYVTTKGYNVVGINGNEVGNMRNAIETYVMNIRTYVDTQIEAVQSELPDGFRGGDAEKAVSDYLEKVRSYVNNLVSGLNGFSDKLADVANAWVRAQSNFSTTVNTSSGSFSAGTVYENEIQYNGASR